MKKIKISQLRENKVTSTLYVVDSNFENLVTSISLFGVLEPLIVFESVDSDEKAFQVVSGNRRLKAAETLGMLEVPCTIIDPVEITELRSSAHQEQRIKQKSDIIRELRILEEEFGLKQGARSDDPKLIEAKKYKESLVKEYNKSAINRLRQFDKKVRELVGDDMKKYASYMKRLDDSNNVSGSLKLIDKELKQKANLELVPTNYEVRTGEYKVLPKSSSDVSDIEDKSVQMVVTSPPYFNLRDYHNGKKELGKEKEVSEFVTRLANHFSDYKRILKDDGTLWINLGDFVVGQGYDLVPERFALKMIENGWIVHDRIVWAKKNPTWTSGKRGVVCTETIFVFKQSYLAHYDSGWLKDMTVENNKVTIGTVKGKIKLRSFFDFRDNVLITHTPNNSKLREACKEQGVTLTHNATFPLSVPLIAILTGSKEGDTVLDSFSGTATTGKACQILGRKYIGYEVNPTFMKMGEIRLQSSNKDYVEYLDVA